MRAPRRMPTASPRRDSFVPWCDREPRLRQEKQTSVFTASRLLPAIVDTSSHGLNLLFATNWVAILLFVAGEVGKRLPVPRSVDRRADLVAQNPRGYFDRRAAIPRTLRASYFVVLVNLAVMFARHRAAGTVLMSILLWSWTARHRGVHFALPMDRRKNH